MFATSLIVFRETLEAALFVGIVAASTRGLSGRGRWLSLGVFAGLLGSLGVAAGMGQISAWADGIGQDLLNVGIIGVALIMLTWHCVWMSSHAKDMVQDAKQLAKQATLPNGSLMALAVAVALAVLREGAETVLFVAGFMSGTSESLSAIFLSVALGLTAGSLVGVLIYFGLARIKTQHLFAVTNGLILLLIGSLASQLGKNLIQSGLISHGGEPLWSTEAWLSNDSALGVFLHALAGYDANPAALQVLLYVTAVTLVWVATHQVKKQRVVAPVAQTAPQI
jgi:high-affinity iron transporter